MYYNNRHLPLLLNFIRKNFVNTSHPSYFHSVDSTGLKYGGALASSKLYFVSVQTAELILALHAN